MKLPWILPRIKMKSSNIHLFADETPVRVPQGVAEAKRGNDSASAGFRDVSSQYKTIFRGRRDDAIVSVKNEAPLAKR
ncbi:hypothetical protein GCM10009414_04590 [Tatumella terrea]